MAINHQEKGFTVIELIVVIAVIVVLPTIVIANFPAIRQQFALSRAAHKFAQDVRLAADKTLSGAVYKDSSGIEQAISGYGVHIDLGSFTIGSTKYFMYADKAPGNQRYDAFDYIVQTIDVEPGIVIREIQDENNFWMGLRVSINFSPPNPIITFDPSRAGVNVIFSTSNEYTAPSKKVYVNLGGLIEIK